MNILLIGGAGSLNLGDEALLLTAVQCIRRFLPTAHLTVATPDEAIARWTLTGQAFETVPAASRCLFNASFFDRHYAKGDHVFEERWERCLDLFLWGSPDAVSTRLMSGRVPSFIDRKDAARLYSALLNADAVIVYGGGILTSPTRSRLWNMSLMAQICERLGKPLFLRSHQIGPIFDTCDEEKLKNILDSAAMVSVRDKGSSKAVCNRASPALEVHELADDALFVQLAKDGHAPAILRRHGVAARAYIAVCYRDHHSLEQSPTFRRHFAEATRFAQELYKMPVLFIPMARADGKILSRLRRIAGGGQVMLWRPFSWDAAVLLRHAFMTISLPHHSLIFSLRGGTPVVSPVSGKYYRFKNRGSMEVFGLADAVVEFESDPDTFLERIKDRIAEAGKSSEMKREKNDCSLRFLLEEWDRFNQQFMGKIAG